MVVSYLLGAARAASIRTSSSKGDEHIEIAGPYRVSVNEANAHLAAVLGGFGHLAVRHLHGGRRTSPAAS